MDPVEVACILWRWRVSCGGVVDPAINNFDENGSVNTEILLVLFVLLIMQSGCMFAHMFLQMF